MLVQTLSCESCQYVEFGGNPGKILRFGLRVWELCLNNFGNNDGIKESRIIPEF